MLRSILGVKQCSWATSTETGVPKWGTCHSRTMAVVGVLAFMLVAVQSPCSAQSASDAELQAAIRSYRQLSFPAARAGIQRALTSGRLTPRDRAIGELYWGLLHFAASDRDGARASFERAVQADPAVQLDSTHASDRVALYREARARVPILVEMRVDPADFRPYSDGPTTIGYGFETPATGRRPYSRVTFFIDSREVSTVSEGSVLQWNGQIQGRVLSPGNHLFSLEAQLPGSPGSTRLERQFVVSFDEPVGRNLVSVPSPSIYPETSSYTRTGWSRAKKTVFWGALSLVPAALLVCPGLNCSGSAETVGTIFLNAGWFVPLFTLAVRSHPTVVTFPIPENVRRNEAGRAEYEANQARANELNARIRQSLVMHLRLSDQRP